MYFSFLLQAHGGWGGERRAAGLGCPVGLPAGGRMSLGPCPTTELVEAAAGGGELRLVTPGSPMWVWLSCPARTRRANEPAREIRELETEAVGKRPGHFASPGAGERQRVRDARRLRCPPLPPPGVCNLLTIANPQWPRTCARPHLRASAGLS